MKLVRRIFDAARPHFSKGGRLETFYPLFEAQENFLFTPRDRTVAGAHIRDRLDTKRLMSTVIVALLPSMLFGIYNVGYQHYQAIGQAPALVPCVLLGLRYVLPIVVVSYAVGGFWEVLFAVVRKHEINEGFLVTGLLFPLVLPPTIPLWQVAIGVSFGVVIGKEVFGGTGMNIFNPALVARGFVFFAYPAQISGDKVWRVMGHGLVDGYSGATPLAVVASHSVEAAKTILDHPGAPQHIETARAAVEGFGHAGGFADFSLGNAFIGLIPGSIGETSTLMVLIGAAVLILTGIGSWRIIVSAFLGALVMGVVFNVLAPQSNPGHYAHLPFYYHFVLGGFAFGAVFMATDPVSAAQTKLGKWIYGFLIGALTILVRVVNAGYAEGMMLSILLMNAFAPLIDYFVVHRNIVRRQERALAT